MNVAEFVETDLQEGVHLRGSVGFAALSSDGLAEFGENLNRLIEHFELSLGVLEENLQNDPFGRVRAYVETIFLFFQCSCRTR